jgi:hypothetical protein
MNESGIKTQEKEDTLKKVAEAKSLPSFILPNWGNEGPGKDGPMYAGLFSLQ